MNSRERMVCALERGKPDRVPVGMFFNCDYLTNLAGMSVYHFLFGTSEDRIRCIQTLCDRHDQDWIMCDPGISKTWSDRHRVVVEDDGAFVVHKESGKRERIRSDLTLHSEEWESEFTPGGSFGYSFATLQCPSEEIKTPSDVKKTIAVHDADALIEEGYFDPQRVFYERYGDERYICLWGGNILFNTLYFFGSLEAGLMALYDAPDVFRALLEVNLAQEIESAQAGARIGGHGVWVAEMLGSADMISPEMYDEWIFPMEKELIEAIHAAGLQAILYLTGDVIPRIPAIKRTGADGLAVENRDKHGAQIDIGAVRNAAGMDLCLCGNIDPVYHLQRGSAQQIENEVQRQIERAGTSGAFIVHSNVVPGAVSPDKVDVMIHAAREYGLYEE